MPSTRLARQHKLEFQIQRLSKKIIPLQTYSNRVAWSRLLIVIVGLLAAYALGARLSAPAGWLTAALTVVVFIAVAVYHRRYEHWIELLQRLRALNADYLARMTLDWDNIPAPVPLETGDKKALALDLDLTSYRSLHQLLNTTISRQGSQLLFDWLTPRHPALDEIHARQAIVRELAPRVRFRERFQLAFRAAHREQLEGENLVQWLATDFPSARLPWLLVIATVLVVTNIVLFVLNNWFGAPPLWIGSLVIYGFFWFSNQGALETVLKAMVRLNDELGKFSALLRFLEKASYAGAPNLAALCAPLRAEVNPPSSQLRRVKTITTAASLRENPVLGLLLNLILPWDFMFALMADRARVQTAQAFPQWVQICEQLDALVALGNFGYLNPENTFPELSLNAHPVLHVEGMGHPLIRADQKVRNDLQVETLGEVEIITGSNMAGKSTFIKTVGVNMCLAYAGAPVDAARFSQSTLMRLDTCIRITDSLADGFSYFYAEVKCLKRVLDELYADDPLPLLYLIDEIFRGTNNRERLIGSRAYVRALLGANGIGLLSTHDLELATLAQDSAHAHNYHFRDQVHDGILTFDYALQTGPSPTTNALKIMALEGLPVGEGDGA